MNSESCPRCGSSLLPKAKFCGSCSMQVLFEDSVKMFSSEWKPFENEFAVRVNPTDLRALLTKGVNVDESQTGLLFESGRFEHELNPGRHKLESLPDRIKKLITGQTASVVLIRKGLCPIRILGETLSADGYEISFSIELGVKMGNRNNFYMNLMQSQNLVTMVDIMRLFSESVRQTIFGIIGSCQSDELHGTHPELQQRFIDSVFDLTSPIAKRWGLEIEYISPPVFSNQKVAAFQHERAQLTRELRDLKLKQSYEEQRESIEIAGFQAGRALTEAKLQQTIEEAERTGEYEKIKTELKHQQQIHALQIDDTLEAAIDEYQVRKTERLQKKDDQQSLRSHLLSINETNREKELASLQFEFQKQSIENQEELGSIERTNRIQAAQQELEAELLHIETSQKARLENWKNRKAIRREEGILDAETDAKIDTIKAESDLLKESKTFDEQIRQGKAETELEQDSLEGLSKLQAEHQKRLLEIDQQKKANESEVAQSQHELEESTKQAERHHELDKMKLMAEMPEMVQLIEMAKLAVNSPAMTESFGDVMKMAMAKGMTPQQLELMAAQQSPGVALALQERYKAEAAAASEIAEQRAEMFERMIVEIKTASTLSQQQVTDLVNRMERIGINGQQMLRDVGIGSIGANTQNEPVAPAMMQSLLKEMENLKQQVTLPQQTKEPKQEGNKESTSS